MTRTIEATDLSVRVKPDVLTRHRMATKQLAEHRDRLATLERQLAAAQELSRDIAELAETQDLGGFKQRILRATASVKSLGADAIVAEQITGADAVQMRNAARLALLPEGGGQPGSVLWNARSEVTATRATLLTARSNLSELRSTIANRQRLLASGMATSGAELAGLRGDVEIGAAVIAKADAAVRAAEAAVTAANERDAAMTARARDLRAVVMEIDDVNEVEVAAVAFWDLLTMATA